MIATKYPQILLFAFAFAASQQSFADQTEPSGPRLVELCTANGCRMIDPMARKPARQPAVDDASSTSAATYKGEPLDALEVAARDGNGLAAYKAGSVYLGGLAGHEVDLNRAIELFSLGADVGHAPSARGAALALLELGRPSLPESTDQTDEDTLSTSDPASDKEELFGGEDVLERAAPESPIADDVISTLPPEKASKMIAFLYQAAEGNDLRGMMELGRLLYSGVFVERDTVSAAYWFDRAATAGSADAKYYLGQMHFRGQGRRQSSYEAIRITKSAAESGSVLAQRALGQLYINGYQTIGVDALAAERWLTAATRNGDPSSAELLELLKSGEYIPGGQGFMLALSPGDVVSASDAAMRGIEAARERVKNGGNLVIRETVEWPDRNGDGLPDGQSVVSPAAGQDCYTIEHETRGVGGLSEERVETVCRQPGGGYGVSI